MTDLPEFGARVKVWPAPGRSVPHGPPSLNMHSAIRWMDAEGIEVEWSAFYLELLRAGDILMHAPPAADSGLGPKSGPPDDDMPRAKRRVIVTPAPTGEKE